jgi:sugar phosphate isomerase/epimerase
MKPATAMRGRRPEAIMEFMRLGYNTNGFAHHRLEDTLAILSKLGYQSVALTLDYHVLNPYDPDLPRQVGVVRNLLEQGALHSVVETGARFLLDPWQKHQPTLVSATASERARRLDFLRRAVDIAHELGSEAVSFWSGAPQDDPGPDLLMTRLAEGCRSLCEYAAGRQVRLAFEPEPGMFIDTMARFGQLRERVDHPSFGLTVDIGHLHCQGETPISDQLQRWRNLIWNIHIEDMHRGIHDHLLFGEGEIEFGPVLRTLKEIGYSGGIHVELSRHSHDAVQTAQRAFTFLHRALQLVCS